MTFARNLRPWCRRRGFAVLVLGSLAWSQLFVNPHGFRIRPGPGRRSCTLYAMEDMEDIQKMRAKEIKKELIDQGVDVSDIFDKDELVQRLFQLRSGTLPKPTAEPVPVQPEPAAEAVAEPAAAVAPASAPSTQDFIQQCRAMKVVQLRTELGQRGIQWADALDKDELVERLAAVLAKEAAFCKSGRLKPGIVTKITGNELEEELADSTTPLLLDVYATWCGPCKVMEPQLAAAAKKLGNKIRVAKMDSDEEGDASTKLGIGGLPTLILFDRSGKPVHRFEGAVMEDQIIQMVEANL